MSEDKDFTKYRNAQIIKMVSTDGWRLYKTELESIIIKTIEMVMTCPKDNVDSFRGQVVGLRTAIHLAEELSKEHLDDILPKNLEDNE